MIFLCQPLPRQQVYREAHTDFAGKSICLTADNVRNEVVTILRSLEVFENAVCVHVDIQSN
jgi:hypothetical protein